MFSLVQHTSLTIRRLDPRLKRRLRVRAAAHGRSMEEEAREILRQTLASERPNDAHLVEQIRRAVKPVGYIELVVPKREPMEPPPRFE
jgi:plasmid stability protein